MKIFVYIVSAVVFAAVVVGFIAVGSPGTQRLRRFDLQRINNLSMIQNEIINFWQVNKKLPTTLNEMKNEVRGFALPADPETGEPYEYAVKGDPINGEFQLCATFALADDAQTSEAYPRYFPGNWQHGAGRHCFDRKLEEQEFPFYGKPMPIPL